MRWHFLGSPATGMMAQGNMPNASLAHNRCELHYPNLASSRSLPRRTQTQVSVFVQELYPLTPQGSSESKEDLQYTAHMGCSSKSPTTPCVFSPAENLAPCTLQYMRPIYPCPLQYRARAPPSAVIQLAGMSNVNMSNVSCRLVNTK